MSKTTNPYNRVHPNDPIHNSELGTQDGLTKREYFAAIAMQGMFSQHGFLLKDTKELSEIAVKCADALIKALNEGGQNE